MKKLLFILVVIFTLSCENNKTTYPFDQSPYLELEHVEYIDSTIDTLSVSFLIWDLEGDIGLSNSEVDFPYQRFDAVIDSDDILVTISNNPTPPLYTVPASYDDIERQTLNIQNRTLYSDQVDRPEYSCESYEVFHPDTLFLLRNLNHHNIEIEFADRNGQEFDYMAIFNISECELGSFDGRIPYVNLSPINSVFEIRNFPFRIEYVNRYARRVTYAMQSQAFRLLFMEDPFHIRVRIRDRELNASNLVDSGPIRLDEIAVD